MNETINTPQETAKAVYDRLASGDRAQYVQRAEESAKYTIPSIFPKTSDTSSTEYKIGYQSIGARGVNNLASKLMLALMPPNSPFFRLSVSEKALADLAGKQDVQVKVEEALGRVERSIMRYIETRQIRVTVTEALKGLIITGNGLLYLPPKEGGIKLYKLNNYVVQRDGLGNVILIVTVDKLSIAALPEEVKKLVLAKDPNKKPYDSVSVYTHVSLEGDQYVSFQEVEGVRVAGSEQTFPKLKTPWIPLRMVKVDGESYGRGFVEEYLGDLISLEGLSKAIVELSAICATVIFLVHPNGQTRAAKVAKAKSGDFVQGRKEDIDALTLDKYADLQVAKATKDDIEARMSYVFLLNSSVQRNGERVTAEEIRYVAGELEDTLGGLYSILSQELQLALIRRLIPQLQSTGEIPDLPDEAIEPSITTGLEAIGRGHDLNKLTLFLEFIQKIPNAALRLKLGSLLIMLATSLGIDTSDLVKSDEEYAQEQAQQQQLAMLQQATPNLAKSFGDAQLQNQTA
jgi:hypothetical protein